MLTVLHELAEDFSTGPLLILAFRANTSLLLFLAGRFFPPDANKKHAESLRALRTLSPNKGADSSCSYSILS